MKSRYLNFDSVQTVSPVLFQILSSVTCSQTTQSVFWLLGQEIKIIFHAMEVKIHTVIFWIMHHVVRARN